MLVKPDAAPSWLAASRLEIALATAVMVAYALLLPELGFIATALAATYLTWRLSTAPLWAIVTGVLTSVGIFIVFRLILGLSLARGILGF
ncbi:MAG: tripartite tricarboxylate transporter TctB family protein [Geminicoccaceae bacterium]